MHHDPLPSPSLSLYWTESRRATTKKNARSKSMFEWVYGNTVDDVDHRSISSATTTAATVPISPKISDDYVQSFLIRFSKALVTYGAPSHRLDHCVQLLMRKFGIKAQFGYFPGFLVVSFGDPESLTAAAQLVKVSPGLDLQRLCSIYQLFESILCDKMTVQEAFASLENIVASPDIYPTWLTILCYGLASSTSTLLFFSGGLMDILFGFISGLIVATGVVHVSNKITRFTSIFDVLTSAVVGFLSAAAASRITSPTTCFHALSLGGVVTLLPGYATFVSVLEMASGSVATGTLQLTTTLIYSLLVGFGLAIGASAHQVMFPKLALVSSDEVCSRSLSWLFDIILVPSFAAANLVIMRGRISKYPIMLLLAALSRGIHQVCMNYFVAYPHIATVLAAFGVATASNVYARLVPTVGFVDMIMGLLFLVPGSVGVSSSLDTFGQALTSSPMTEVSVILNAGQQGIIFSSHMMVIAVSVSVGLVLAAAVLYPVRKMLDYKRSRKNNKYRVRDWVGEVTF